MTKDAVEYVLMINKQITVEFDCDPRDKMKLINTSIVKKSAAGRHHEDDIDSDGEDDREYLNN